MTQVPGTERWSKPTPARAGGAGGGLSRLRRHLADLLIENGHLRTALQQAHEHLALHTAERDAARALLTTITDLACVVGHPCGGVAAALSTIAGRAACVSGADGGLIWLWDATVPGAAGPAAVEGPADNAWGGPDRRHVAAAVDETVQVADVRATPAGPARWECLRDAHPDARTVLATPLRHHGAAIGTLVVYRTAVCPFSDEHARLLESCATLASLVVVSARTQAEWPILRPAPAGAGRQ